MNKRNNIHLFVKYSISNKKSIISNQKKDTLLFLNLTNHSTIEQFNNKKT